jgi:hypothetical protein
MRGWVFPVVPAFDFVGLAALYWDIDGDHEFSDSDSDCDLPTVPLRLKAHKRFSSPARSAHNRSGLRVFVIETRATFSWFHVRELLALGI